MRIISRSLYYFGSIKTLLEGINDPLRTIKMFLGRPGLFPAEIQLRRTGWRFAVRTKMDIWVIKETCLDEDYLWAVAGLGPDWNIVDIGAGLGDFTVYAAKHCPDGVVLAYEPLPESFDLLQRNLAINAITNVQAYNLATAETSSSLALEEVEREAVSTRFVVDKSSSRETTAVQLEHVLDLLPNGRCDFMKIDCEGCEYDLILNSRPEVLHRINRISMEYHDEITANSGLDLAEHLTSLGFIVQMRKNPVHDVLGFLYAEKSLL